MKIRQQVFLPTSNRNRNIWKHPNKCLLYKIQYVENSEISFHIRFNNYRNNVKNPNVIEPFWQWEPVYRGYEKFKLITRLKNIKTTSRGFKAENEKKEKTVGLQD